MPDQIFHFRLKTLSPLHIGCGDVYEPMSFVVDDVKMELVSFDPADFLGKLEEEALRRFSEICRKGTVASLIELYKFMNSHKTLAQGSPITCSTHFVEHYKRVLALTNRDLENGVNQFQIGRTAFNPRSGWPYIPGSAVKGAIRTAILNLRAKGKTINESDANQLQKTLLGGGFENDPFSLIKVSDFMPITTIQCRIVYMVNRKKKKADEAGRVPLSSPIVEVVQPNMEFVGSITIQENIRSAIKKPVTLDEIRKAMRSFYGKERDREDMDASSIDCPHIPAYPETGELIRLGRHSGAECLTIDGHRKIKVMYGPRRHPRPFRMTDHPTTLWFASSDSRPHDNTTLKPFGWTAMELLSEQKAKQCKKQADDLHQQWMEAERGKYAQNREREEKSRLLALKAAEDKARADAEEEKRREEEARYPWRKLLPALEAVQDWGALKQKALDYAELKSHQAEPEVGQAIKTAAIRVRTKYRKTWTPERDQIIAEWLQPSGILWEQAGSVAPGKKDSSRPTASAVETWEQYKASGVVIESLSEPDAQSLQKVFRKMELHKTSKREKKTEWERLKKHLASFRGSRGPQ